MIKKLDEQRLAPAEHIPTYPEYQGRDWWTKDAAGWGHDFAARIVRAAHTCQEIERIKAAFPAEWSQYEQLGIEQELKLQLTARDAMEGTARRQREWEATVEDSKRRALLTGDRAINAERGIGP